MENIVARQVRLPPIGDLADSSSSIRRRVGRSIRPVRGIGLAQQQRRPAYRRALGIPSQHHVLASDQPLQQDLSAKRIALLLTPDGGRTLTLSLSGAAGGDPAGALLRVSSHIAAARGSAGCRAALLRAAFRRILPVPARRSPRFPGDRRAGTAPETAPATLPAQTARQVAGRSASHTRRASSGYDDFRPLQEDHSAPPGRQGRAGGYADGSGKTSVTGRRLCLRRAHVAVSHSSPQMQDQVEQLRERSRVSTARAATRRTCRRNRPHRRVIRLLPRRNAADGRRCRGAAGRSNVACLVIDEAHCISG